MTPHPARRTPKAGLDTSTDATNNYPSTDASSLNGRKCIAGYCRNETVLFMVR